MKVPAEVRLDDRGIGADRVRAPLGDLAPVAQHRDPVRDIHDQADHGLDEQDTHATLVEPEIRLVMVVSDRITVDRKSTRLNSSHSQISYAVFCLKKKNILSC